MCTSRPNPTRPGIQPSLRRPNRHFADHTPPISIFIHDEGAIGRVDDGQHLVSIRRAAIREARQRMSAQELADRLGMSRSRVYAVLASADNATGPLTIHYRTADGGVGEAPVAWTVEPLRGTRRIRVTREEIRYRRTAQVVMVVVPADSVDVEPTPTDSRLDGAFRSLENQAAYALSQADLAAPTHLTSLPIRHPPGWVGASRWTGSSRHGGRAPGTSPSAVGGGCRTTDVRGPRLAERPSAASEDSWPSADRGTQRRRGCLVVRACDRSSGSVAPCGGGGRGSSLHSPPVGVQRRNRSDQRRDREDPQASPMRC